VWAHSTCSQKALREALDDPTITAIETDVVMGKYLDCEDWVPILSHDVRKSDLSMQKLLEMASKSISLSNDSTNSNTNTSKQINLTKHLKLDFKELEAVKPTIDILHQLDIRFYGSDGSANNNLDNAATIFLNADVLPGPGMRHADARVNGDAFLSTCLKENNNQKYAFSLGWATDARSLEGYTDEDVIAMLDLIERHDVVNSSIGIVLAVNARVLVQDCKALDRLLTAFPSSQMLIWTATGEPPISKRKMKIITSHFLRQQTHDRIGYDCVIASTFIMGLIYDSAIGVASFFYNIQYGFNRKKQLQND